MAKLEKLTPEQEALLPVVRDEYTYFALHSHEPINKEQAEASIRWMYGLAGLEAPKVIFASSPLACQVVANLYGNTEVQEAIKAGLSSAADNIAGLFKDAQRSACRPETVGLPTVEVSTVLASLNRTTFDIWRAVLDAVNESIEKSGKDNLQAGAIIWGAILTAVGPTRIGVTDTTMGIRTSLIDNIRIAIGDLTEAVREAVKVAIDRLAQAADNPEAQAALALVVHNIQNYLYMVEEHKFHSSSWAANRDCPGCRALSEIQVPVTAAISEEAFGELSVGHSVRDAAQSAVENEAAGDTLEGTFTFLKNSVSSALATEELHSALRKAAGAIHYAVHSATFTAATSEVFRAVLREVYVDLNRTSHFTANMVANAVEEAISRPYNATAFDSALTWAVLKPVGNATSNAVSNPLWNIVRKATQLHESFSPLCGLADYTDAAVVKIIEQEDDKTTELISSTLGKINDSLALLIGCCVCVATARRIRMALNVVTHQILEIIQDSVADAFKNVKLKHISPAYWGVLYDAGWVAFYDYFTRIGVVNHENFNKYKEYIKAGVFYGIFFKDVAVVCGRPEYIKQDERNRLHCADGPAVQWADGWSIYKWHGITVPKKLIERPDTVTKEDLIREMNAEIRRAFLEKLGSERFFELLDVEIVSKEYLGHKGFVREYVLYRTKKVDPAARDHINFLRMECHSTGRVYIICVPPDITTAKDARSWLFPVERYDPVVET